MKKAVLLDVSAIMYRSFFSLKEMRNKRGIHTGALYGFATMFYRVIEEFSPDYIYACFDVKRSELLRRSELESYKANREGAPEELLLQIPLIEEFLENYNIKKIKIMGHEADDVISTVASKLKVENIYTTVITSDKDMAQIVEEGIEIALMQHGKYEFNILKNRNDVYEKFGVYPDQIPDFFGLKGDASDGIPGVKGIGDKTAQRLISEYTTLEGVYENILSQKGKMRENLENEKEMAFLSRKLATTQRDLEINLELISLNLEHQNQYSLFKTCDFSSLIKKYKIDTAKILEVPQEAGTLFDIIMPDGIINDNSVVRKIAFSEIGILKNNQVVILNVDDKFYAQFEDSQYIELSPENLKTLLFGHYEIIGYNLKETVVKKVTSRGNCKFYDIMLMEHLLSPDMKISEIALYEKYGISNDVLKGEIGIFNHLKALKFLFILLKSELEKEKLFDLYERFEMPLISILASMEVEGIELDLVEFEKMNSEVADRLKKLEIEIFKLSHEEFNLNSPKQLGVVLFEKMGYPVIKKTKTGVSTDVEVLETLSKMGYEIAQKLLEYRELAKLMSTYIRVLPTLIDENFRIHTTFNQMGTATGRLSSANPNLQNIPSKTNMGKRIRKGFVAKKGYKFISADYSQIELRVLAELTEDKKLITAYQSKRDLHKITAQKLFNKVESDVTSFERMIGKTINFSVIYGKTPYGLSGELGISVKEASNYIKGFFEQYPRVQTYLEDIISRAKESGVTYTYFNRRRIIQNINSSNKSLREHANRAAMNSVIQGTASDIIKLSMIALYEKIKNSSEIKMLLQIHDELIFEVKEEAVLKYFEIIKKNMQDIVNFKHVPLDVDISMGGSWEELK